jgi:hypothetical protein
MRHRITDACRSHAATHGGTVIPRLLDYLLEFVHAGFKATGKNR